MADIRTAQLEDIPSLVAMARDMHAESPRYRDRHFSDEKLAHTIAQVLNQRNALMMVSVEEGVLTGMVCCVTISDTFGDDRYVADLVVYVRKDYRGSSLFPRLVSRLEEWAFDTQGVNLIALGISADIDSERVVELYEKLGYKKNSYTMIKRKD